MGCPRRNSGPPGSRPPPRTSPGAPTGVLESVGSKKATFVCLARTQFHPQKTPPTPSVLMKCLVTNDYLIACNYVFVYLHLRIYLFPLRKVELERLVTLETCEDILPIENCQPACFSFQTMIGV